MKASQVLRGNVYNRRKKPIYLIQFEYYLIEPLYH